jgi:hypothetical protein
MNLKLSEMGEAVAALLLAVAVGVALFKAAHETGRVVHSRSRR